MKELELIEALCIVQIGLTIEEERELYDYAYKVVEKVAKTKHLEYYIHKIKQELERLNRGNKTYLDDEKTNK